VVTKTDQLGNVIWSNFYGDGNQNGLFYAWEVTQTADSGFVITGFQLISSTELLVFKLNNSGGLLWSKSYNNGTDASGVSIKETADGELICLGRDDANSQGEDFLLIKIDQANGNILWAKKYGGSSADEAKKVIELPDKGFALIGTTTSFGAGLTDLYLVRTDSLGNILWTKTYGNTGYEEGQDLKITADGGFILMGTSYTWEPNGDVYLLRTDSLGNLLWSRTYDVNGSDFGYGVVETASGFAVACSTVTYMWPVLFKTTATGTLLWAKKYGIVAYGDFKALIIHPDQGFAALGYSSDTIFGSGADVFLVKTDSNGSSGCYEVNIPVADSLRPTISGSGGIMTTVACTQSLANLLNVFSPASTLVNCLSNSMNELTEMVGLNIFPDPSQGKFTIHLPYKIREIHVFDLLGSRICVKENIFSQETEIDLTSFRTGIYFVKVTDDRGNSFTQKIVLE
jgi:hypothetical protein